MIVLTLDEVKNHLKIELADTSRDTELEQFEARAVSRAQEFIGRSIPWMDALGAPVAVPDSVKWALLLYIGDIDQQRENTVVGLQSTDTRVAESLLFPSRVGLGI